jgi:hypothetical protein
VPDQIDPDPLMPGEFGDVMEEATRVLALVVQATDLAPFNGPNNNANAGRRNSLAGRCSKAANRIGNVNVNSAIALLESVLAKIDGDDSQADWIDDSPVKTALADDVNLLIALLMMP